jgi:hypothetical protein
MSPLKNANRTVLRVTRCVKEAPLLPKVGRSLPEIAFSTARYGVGHKWKIWETPHNESPQASAARLGKINE